jgi:hypothetical protein
VAELSPGYQQRNQKEPRITAAVHAGTIPEVSKRVIIKEGRFKNIFFLYQES